MFFGLFGSSPKRKTSRPKRKTSRKPFKGTVRKGYLNHGGLSAKTASGRFAGRIRLQRSALVEYPNADQLVSIARQYGIPKDITQRAFGHMMKEPANKAKPARKTSRRKTSGRRKTSRRRLRRNAGSQRVIRRDYISVPTATDGSPIPFSAATMDVPERLIGILGAPRAVAISIAGEKPAFTTAAEAMRISAPWVTKKEFRRAFGLLLRGATLGDTGPQKGIPHVYGPRTMKLGHVPGWKPGDPLPTPAKGEVAPQIVPGQLILFHKPTGSIVWQAYDDEDSNPKKPIFIKYGGGTKHFEFDKALQGARTGKGSTRSKEPVGAMDRNIPPMAMLRAFDYLLAPAQRKNAYAMFVIKRPG